MTDLRTLMHEAAPEPRRALDIDDIRQRARMHGTRRLIAWLAGLGVVLAAAVGVGAPVLHPADGKEVSVDSRQHPPVTTTWPRGAETAAAPLDEPLPAALSDGVRTRPSSNASSTTTEVAVVVGPVPVSVAAVTEVGEAADAGHPRAPSCSVSNAGLAPRGTRSCGFTATTTGSAGMSTEGDAGSQSGVEVVVTVVRGGTTTVYSLTSRSTRAGELGVVYAACEARIEAGDVVDVELRNADVPVGTTVAGAGEGWNCAGRA